MNSLETVILVIILLSLVIMYIDVLSVSQQMSASTAVANYVARTLERQGGILNYVPTNFATYGHGSYTTSKSACDIINNNLEKTFGPSALGEFVDVNVKIVYSDGESRSISDTQFKLAPNSCFGLYLGGNGTFSETSPGFISIKNLKYYKPYYIVTVTMKYDLWVVPAVFEKEGSMLEKTFTRVVVPSYYIQEEHYDSDNTNNDNFFVV